MCTVVCPPSSKAGVSLTLKQRSQTSPKGIKGLFLTCLLTVSMANFETVSSLPWGPFVLVLPFGRFWFSFSLCLWNSGARVFGYCRRSFVCLCVCVCVHDVVGTNTGLTGLEVSGINNRKTLVADSARTRVTLVEFWNKGAWYMPRRKTCPPCLPVAILISCICAFS